MDIEYEKLVLTKGIKDEDFYVWFLQPFNERSSVLETKVEISSKILTVIQESFHITDFIFDKVEFSKDGASNFVKFIQQYKHIIKIEFISCRFSLESANLLKEGLMKSKTLKNIHFTSYTKKQTEEDDQNLSIVLSGLKHNQKVKHLQFFQVDFQCNLLKELNHVLSSNNSIDTLFLLNITNDESNFLEGLEKNQAIKHLSIQNSAILFSPSFLKGNTPLVQLYLQNVNFSKESWESLGLQIGENKHIGFFDIRFTNIDEMSCEKLSHGLEKNTSLISINLELKKLKGMIYILKCLKNAKKLDLSNTQFLENEHLQYLNYSNLNYLYLNGCQIGDIGIEYLVKSIINNYNIEELYLDNNNIQDKGYEILGNYIEKNGGPKKLTLQSQTTLKKCFHGVDSLFKALKTNKRMEFLKYNFNYICKDCSKNFPNYLKNNHTLKTLSFINTDFRENITNIYDILALNESLTSLYLSNNMINPDINYLGNVLFYNYSIKSNTMSIIPNERVLFLLKRNEKFIKVPYDLKGAQDLNFYFK